MLISLAIHSANSLLSQRCAATAVASTRIALRYAMKWRLGWIRNNTRFLLVYECRLQTAAFDRLVSDIGLLIAISKGFLSVCHCCWSAITGRDYYLHRAFQEYGTADHTQCTASITQRQINVGLSFWWTEEIVIYTWPKVMWLSRVSEAVITITIVTRMHWHWQWQALTVKRNCPASCLTLASSTQRTMIVNYRFRPSHSVNNSWEYCGMTTVVVGWQQLRSDTQSNTRPY